MAKIVKKKLIKTIKPKRVKVDIDEKKDFVKVFNKNIKHIKKIIQLNASGAI